ncbi:hypothetical protein [Polymorphospora lycopeni]|uniref:Minor tail protein n=1 Tax=Polymorphospora lycopeni TaxID=3140240 RepID=A0ABV5CNM4_9ACTN
MAESSYPDPSVTQLQHERLLGRLGPSGLLGSPADLPLVYADGTGTRTTKIRANRQALVEGYGWENDGVEVTKTHAANSSGQTRIDVVVLRLSRSTWDVTSQIVQGTPGAGPPAVTMQTGSSGVWELPVADVAVASGATTFAGSVVTPRAWYVGDDGQIICTSTTRPPHSPGRQITETNTGQVLVSVGSQWLILREDTGWVPLTPAAGWGARLLQVRRLNGQVTLWCNVRRTGSTLAANTTSIITTLPTGFRPAVGGEVIEIPAITPSAPGYTFRVSVNAAGQVRVDSPHGGLGPTSHLGARDSWPV